MLTVRVGASAGGGPGAGTSSCAVVVVVVVLLGDISSCACTGVSVVDCSGGAGGLVASAESRSMLERQFSGVMGTGGK